MIVGKIIGGSSGKVVVRVKSDASVDIGDILIAEDKGVKYYIKVVNVLINSLLPGQFIDDIAGQKLEYNADVSLFEEKDRFFKICEAKLLKVLNGEFIPARNIPHYFSDVRLASGDDFAFLNNVDGVNVGCLRLGTKSLDGVNVCVPVRQLITHHVLISAATGKGKSNFAKVFINGLLSLDNVSCLVIDPHNEYYGCQGVKGLRDLRNPKLLFITPKPENYPGSERLLFYGEDLGPGDFMEVIGASSPQSEALNLARGLYGRKWLLEFLINHNIEEVFTDFKGKVRKETIAALKRKLQNALGIHNGIKGLTFTLEERKESSVFDVIKRAVNDGRIIIIDTSLVGDLAERLISSSIVRELFRLYRLTKEEAQDKFRLLPELMILFEEAPRVLGKAVLERGSNVFAKIAREGRKFKIGLCAITQMPSLLPSEILSQMNTKVILGLSSPIDRNAIINSSAQDISDEALEIQMLDKGEALITSPFIKFPFPVKVHFFDSLIKASNVKDFNIGIS